MYPDQEYRNNGGSCHLKRYKKGLHLFEQQVKTKQICQQLSPNDWLEFVCKWLYDTLECTFILCRLQNQSTLIHLQRSFESFKIHAVCITMQSLRFTRYTKTTPTVLKTKWSVPRVFGTPQPSGNRQDTVLPRYGTESEESNLFVLCFIIALICIHACKIKYQDQQIKKIMYCYVFEEYFETSHTLKQILKKKQFINISLRFYKYELLLE